MDYRQFYLNLKNKIRFEKQFCNKLMKRGKIEDEITCFYMHEWQSSCLLFGTILKVERYKERDKKNRCIRCSECLEWFKGVKEQK